MPRTLSIESNDYKRIVDSFSSEDLHLIAQIKRLLECLRADSKFRQAIEENPHDQGVRDYLAKIKVDFDYSDWVVLWTEKGIKVSLKYLLNPSDDDDPENDPEMKDLPTVRLWAAWNKAQTARFDDLYSNLPMIPKHARFDTWRQRRIKSAKSELGHFGNKIDHPMFAFELCKGCSIGCWFCGFSAKKLSAVFDYTENKDLWRNVVKEGQDRFGAGAALAMCYYATEPYDNPNYIDFLKDYREITGAPVCTATAAPTKDPAWLRSLIAFYRESVLPWPRISILSVSMLRKVHEIYTPDELRDVGLLVQVKDSFRQKAVSGRARNVNIKELGGIEHDDDIIKIPQGSIACISGFLVNMVDRSIKLVSPCQATDRWPYGFRVFAEETFTDAGDYGAALDRIIKNHMPEHVASGMKLGFRDDLKHELHPDGFSLISPSQRHHVRGKPHLAPLGSLIAEGNRTYAGICDALIEDGASPLAIFGIVRNLFDKGLLDETVL